MIAYCVRNGVPKSEAEEMDYHELVAWTVVNGEFETGKSYDWDNRRWPKE
ncbi:hypothetical protein [Methylosinus sp. PW1]|nr:hypothetical protein [Methylosinus sp. PW1]